MTPEFLNLGNLPATRGARKKRKRIGRGEGSGHGGTSTKGHKGQKARAGGYHKRGFEGGQMPLARRLPKHGFINHFRKEFSIINVGDLNDWPQNTVINENSLRENGFFKKLRSGIKILGNGEIKQSLIFELSSSSKMSEAAKKKIIAAGGQIKALPESHGTKAESKAAPQAETGVKA